MIYWVDIGTYTIWSKLWQPPDNEEIYDLCSTAKKFEINAVLKNSFPLLDEWTKPQFSGVNWNDCTLTRVER